MSNCHFLLTYSVKAQYPILEDDVKKANKVRDKIADISQWDKLENVETTFKGSIYLYDFDSIQTKKNDAVKEIKNNFLPILKECQSGRLDVRIDCAMLVDGLGECLMFEVINDEN
ncbi:TPA: hypothetical protein NJ546_004447 [Vibrio parahaemolyticus]|uniref:hypothetical protein n=1 Tax=Vibrio parahaemolyticus TaxID=670 RepID=UPI00193D541A|nr:hypothetical protein [Vibrio parahaemolyticus]EHK4786560.1 hypothetical protein [Vibrio parahaemolyticus]EIJ0976161.1 hypothetical protein [Vibrio parahaemolyticus]EJO4006072.1 hypothetical protein [Vibrio parahaemolyticus]MBM4992050.1 hypothetical protein [Vibrio parahaemolyticus]MBM4996631.1 hypothetical protein [Vibrio parahaemolyticus]